MITWCNEESVGETTLTKTDQTKQEKSLSHMLSTCIKWYLNCCASSSVSSTNSPCHGQLTTGSRATRRKHHGQNENSSRCLTFRNLHLVAAPCLSSGRITNTAVNKSQCQSSSSAPPAVWPTPA